MSGATTGPERLFAVTICAYKKPGMDEDEYHRYISEKHSSHLTDLLMQNRIVDYTMQHNTSENKKFMGQMFPGMPESNYADQDAYVQIVFRDLDDYLAVKNDPHYQHVVNPDHKNFADGPRTRMMTGWYEKHISNGQKMKA